MELNLFRLSLIISLSGILILIFISFLIEPKLIKTDSINDKLMNQKVKVQGEVLKIKNYEESNFQVISIKDKTGEIDITTNKILNLSNNQTIIVMGKISEYQKNLQIQADKIFLVN